MNPANILTAIFLVEEVIPGPNGGAIFYGKNDVGHDVSAAIDYKWKGCLPAKDEVWRVEGVRKPQSKYPYTIHAKNATIVTPPVGKLTRRFLMEAAQFRGFGFGGGKLDKLEAGLEAKGVSVRDALNEGQIDLMAKFLPIGMVEKLVEAWSLSVKDCELYEFLDEHGFDRSLAASIRKVFKVNVVDRLKKYLYCLLAFGTIEKNMWGKTEAAEKLLGVDRKDPRRLAASVEQAFYDQLSEGHTLVGLDDLKPAVMGLLKTKSDTLFETAVHAAAEQKMLVRCGDGLQAFGPAVLEARVERKLVALSNLDAGDPYLNPFFADPSRFEKLLAQVDAKFSKANGSNLNLEQKNAVRAICTSSLCVVSGGVGTGKTTILRAVHDIVEQTGGIVFQITAGRHLEEATGDRKAYTVHAFIAHLEKGHESPESQDSVVVEEGAHIIIDEASKIGLALLHKLLSLLPNKVKLCMVGDPDQLRPIGFGVVFHLMVGVEGIRTVELKKIVCQEDVTGIPGISESIRVGTIPSLAEFDSADQFVGAANGVSFVSVNKNSDISPALFEVSDKLGHSCQILCARRRFGDDSSNRVNNFFQYRRRDAQHCEQLVRWKMFVGDPVIVTHTSYELSLFEGALGVLVRLDGRTPVFRFGDTEFKLNDNQMVDVGIVLAYGITVHMAQVSEFDRVVVPVTEAKGLDRTLIYTALTRARRQVVFVGDRKVFNDAVKAEPNVSSVSVGFDLRAALVEGRI